MEDLLEDIKYLTVYTAEFSELYSDSKGFFSVVESREISEKIKEFLWKL